MVEIKNGKIKTAKGGWSKLSSARGKETLLASDDRFYIWDGKVLSDKKRWVAVDGPTGRKLLKGKPKRKVNANVKKLKKRKSVAKKKKPSRHLRGVMESVKKHAKNRNMDMAMHMGQADMLNFKLNELRKRSEMVDENLIESIMNLVPKGEPYYASGSSTIGVEGFPWYKHPNFEAHLTNNAGVKAFFGVHEYSGYRNKPTTIFTMLGHVDEEDELNRVDLTEGARTREEFEVGKINRTLKVALGTGIHVLVTETMLKDFVSVFFPEDDIFLDDIRILPNKQYSIGDMFPVKNAGSHPRRHVHVIRGIRNGDKRVNSILNNLSSIASGKFNTSEMNIVRNRERSKFPAMQEYIWEHFPVVATINASHYYRTIRITTPTLGHSGEVKRS